MMQRPLNRIEPDAGPEAFKTYQVVAPVSTHRRRATCAEVDCEKRARGYAAQCDVSTITGQGNAAVLEKLLGRRVRHASRSVKGNLVTYTFPAGQDCLDVHSVPLEREPLYIVRGGDHRGNPLGTASRQLKVADFVDDFSNHQAALADRAARG
ncbi:MAG: hypothetical protein ABWY81_11040 [Jiangellaceae bacterium]